ncbi:MAG: class I SAM-dependent methyltransferase [Bacteroidia bacterium]
MQLLTPQNFADYELIDVGNFEKLERFGQMITIRPEPQALWDKTLSNSEWEKRAHIKFVPKSSSSGEWKKLKNSMPDGKPVPEQWKIAYNIAGESRIAFRLGLTSFKHVGIFPEQAPNWDYIYESVKLLSASLGGGKGEAAPKVLNLFAYTGGASLAAKAAGADITHVDSIKQVVTWSKENMDLSNLSNIRWVVEDALKFVKREEKRGNKYNGIILDPPAYGHGPNGEKWKLEDNISEMMKGVLNILDEKHFLILNAYSLGFSSIIIENLLKEKAGKHLNTGELYLQATAAQSKLPLGVFGRFRNF